MKIYTAPFDVLPRTTPLPDSLDSLIEIPVYVRGEGDGTFDDITIFTPVYTPGTEDIENGIVELSLNAFGTNDSTHTISLAFSKIPIAHAGNNDSICDEENYILDGNAYYYSSILWETSGDGTFNDATSLNAVYTSGIDDKTNGFVTLSLTSEAEPPSCSTYGQSSYCSCHLPAKS